MASSAQDGKPASLIAPKEADPESQPPISQKRKRDDGSTHSTAFAEATNAQVHALFKNKCFRCGNGGPYDPLDTGHIIAQKDTEVS